MSRKDDSLYPPSQLVNILTDQMNKETVEKKLPEEMGGIQKEKSNWNIVKMHKGSLRRGSLQVDARMAFKQKLKDKSQVLPRMLQRRATIASPDKANEALIGLKRSKNLNYKQSSCSNNITE